MARQVMLGEIGVELFTRPVGERVELQPARRTIELEAREPLPRRRLETLASGDRGIEIGQRLFERLHLADFAAAVGVVRPAQLGRSEERRGGKGGVSTWRSRWSPDHRKKNIKK